MRCPTCLKKFRDGERLVPIVRYVTNSHRGDFVGHNPSEFVHYKCIAQAHNG